jgi:hypothetical protein
LGIGLGYKTPNPLAAQIIDYAIENIQPLAQLLKQKNLLVTMQK